MVPFIPRQVTVSRSENYGFGFSRVSSVRTYDAAMLGVFKYFVVLPADVAGEMTSALSFGYPSETGDPLWPSFASMNSGSGSDEKVLWLSEAALQGLQCNLVGQYIMQVEPPSPVLVRSRGYL